MQSDCFNLILWRQMSSGGWITADICPSLPDPSWCGCISLDKERMRVGVKLFNRLRPSRLKARFALNSSHVTDSQSYYVREADKCALQCRPMLIGTCKCDTRGWKHRFPAESAVTVEQNSTHTHRQTLPRVHPAAWNDIPFWEIRIKMYQDECFDLVSEG